MAQLTERLQEAEVETKKHALLLQHIHVSAATDPSHLLTKCDAQRSQDLSMHCARERSHCCVLGAWHWCNTLNPEMPVCILHGVW